ncbi:MAG: hypothetical protein ACTSRW_03505 [Candidatus Helarchaeota archaeon]
MVFIGGFPIKIQKIKILVPRKIFFSNLNGDPKFLQPNASNPKPITSSKEEFLNQIKLKIELLKSNIQHKDNKIKLLQQTLGNTLTRVKTQETIIKRLEERGKLLETIYDENQRLLKMVDELENRDREKSEIIKKLENQIYEINKYTELSHSDFSDRQNSLKSKINALQDQTKELQKYSQEKENLHKRAEERLLELERKIESLDTELMRKDSEIFYLQEKIKDEKQVFVPKKEVKIPMKKEKVNEKYLIELRNELKKKKQRIYDLENQVKQLSVRGTDEHTELGFLVGKIIPNLPTNLVGDFVKELLPMNPKSRNIRIKEIRDLREFNGIKF